MGSGPLQLITNSFFRNAAFEFFFGPNFQKKNLKSFLAKFFFEELTSTIFEVTVSDLSTKILSQIFCRWRCNFSFVLQFLDSFIARCSCIIFIINCFRQLCFHATQTTILWYYLIFYRVGPGLNFSGLQAVLGILQRARAYAGYLKRRW